VTPKPVGPATHVVGRAHLPDHRLLGVSDGDCGKPLGIVNYYSAARSRASLHLPVDAGIHIWMVASSCGCRAGICMWRLLARHCRIQCWMRRGDDAAAQAKGDDTIVAQLPHRSVGIPRPAGLLHSPPGRDIGERDPQRNDLVGRKPRLPCGLGDDQLHGLEGSRCPRAYGPARARGLPRRPREPERMICAMRSISRARR
jgi:hypothetical protein